MGQGGCCNIVFFFEIRPIGARVSGKPKTKKSGVGNNMNEYDCSFVHWLTTCAIPLYM